MLYMKVSNKGFTLIYKSKFWIWESWMEMDSNNMSCWSESIWESLISHANSLVSMVILSLWESNNRVRSFLIFNEKLDWIGFYISYNPSFLMLSLTFINLKLFEKLSSNTEKSISILALISFQLSFLAFFPSSSSTNNPLFYLDVHTDKKSSTDITPVILSHCYMYSITF
jgi:hypothetical protein